MLLDALDAFPRYYWPDRPADFRWFVPWVFWRMMAIVLFIALMPISGGIWLVYQSFATYSRDPMTIRRNDPMWDRSHRASHPNSLESMGSGMGND